MYIFELVKNLEVCLSFAFWQYGDEMQPHQKRNFTFSKVLLVNFLLNFVVEQSQVSVTVRVPVDPCRTGSLYALLRKQIWALKIFSVSSVIKKFSIQNYRRYICVNVQPN